MNKAEKLEMIEYYKKEIRRAEEKMKDAYYKEPYEKRIGIYKGEIIKMVK